MEINNYLIPIIILLIILLVIRSKQIKQINIVFPNLFKIEILKRKDDRLNPSPERKRKKLKKVKH